MADGAKDVGRVRVEGRELVAALHDRHGGLPKDEKANSVEWFITRTLLVRNIEGFYVIVIRRNASNTRLAYSLILCSV